MKTSLLPISLALCALALPTASLATTETGEPDAYLEYIEATGTQYIDTGVKAKTGLKARCDFSWAGRTGDNDDWSLLDAAINNSDSNKRTRFYMCHMYDGGGKPFFGYGLKQRKNPDGSFQYIRGQRYEVVTDMSDTNSLELIQNGKNTFSATDRETFATNGVVNLDLNLFVFACNLSGKAAWYGQGKLYEMKIFQKTGEIAGTNTFDLIRHYIPCIKGGRPGLYDKVEGKIYYSDSGADFNAGPVLDKPLDYVKWIWGNGNQWFDTRVWGRSGIKSEIDISVREYSGDRCILGVRQGNNRIYPAYQYEKQFRYAWGTMPSAGNTTVVNPTNDVSYYMDTRYFIKSDIQDGYQSVLVSKNGGNPTELHKNGVAYNTGEIAITNITLCLLACNNGGSYVYPSKALIYSTKIWDGDELLRDFVPVVATNSEGVAYAGLYDTMSERIFRQIGTAEFDLASQVGGVTNTLRAIERPKTRIEYVDSDALLDYVDLGIIGKDSVEMEAVMEWLRVPNDGAFVGARHNTSNDATGAHRFFLYHHWNSRHRLAYDNDLFEVGSSPATANVKYKIVSRLDVGRGDMTISAFTDGAWNTVASRTVLPENGYDGPVNTGLPLYLFAMNLEGTPRYHGKVRLYRLRLNVKQDGATTYVPARDLVPVKDPGTGAPVLWDKVTQTYFRNAGKYLLAGGGAERVFEGAFTLVVR